MRAGPSGAQQRDPEDDQGWPRGTTWRTLRRDGSWNVAALLHRLRREWHPPVDHRSRRLDEHRSPSGHREVHRRGSTGRRRGGAVTMVTQNQLVETRNAAREAIDRAVEWLLAQQSSDGSFEPLDAGLYCYYKSPMALACRGEVEAGVRLTSWIKANALTEQGDLGGRYGRGLMAFNATYPN